jgi:hypothetical protein
LTEVGRTGYYVTVYVHGEEKKYFFLYWADKSSQDKNLLYLDNEPNEPTKEGLLSFVLLESPFLSVSTVSRGQPSFCV